VQKHLPALADDAISMSGAVPGQLLLGECPRRWMAHFIDRQGGVFCSVKL